MSVRGLASATALFAAACASTHAVTTAIGLPPELRPPAVAVSLQQLGAWDFSYDLKGLPEDLRALSGRQVTLSGKLTLLEGNDALLASSWVGSSAPQDHQMVWLHLPIDVRELPVAEVRVQGELRVGAEWFEGMCTKVYAMRVEHLDLLKTYPTIHPPRQESADRAR